MTIEGDISVSVILSIIPESSGCSKMCPSLSSVSLIFLPNLSLNIRIECYLFCCILKNNRHLVVMGDGNGSIRETDFTLDPALSDSPYRAWTIGVGGSILSSPLVINDTVIFGSNDTCVYALDSQGEKLWSHKTGDIVLSSPTRYKDTVLIGSNDGYLYAFSMNGEVKWKFPSGGKVWATPCVSGGVVYTGSNNGVFHALSADDGKVLWKFNTASGDFFHSAAVVNDSVIFGNMSGFIYRLSTDGKLLWKFQCGSHVA